ncbi:hypothetical protein AVEN_191403-1 [Araneus ventricosus]|uniref:Uncharacterized protein n=1 Tax=Araneus ventricosus TaxID=182803 RepID=A0A4Y2RDC0_ARAVE|nr:hypothetical protein AVEN_191403-1 [Araneus ventricosus]
MGLREVCVRYRWLIAKKLKAIWRERLSVFSFGSVEPMERTYEVGVITLISQYDPEQRISVEVLISETIPSADVREDMESRGLRLADTCESG